MGHSTRQRWCAGGLCLALVACGEPSSSEPAPEPLCGDVGPRLLLELAEGEYVERVHVRDAGDAVRLVLEVVGYDDAVPPHELGRRLFAADECGEQARELGMDLELAALDDLVLACDGDALLTIDPVTGAEQRVIEDVACAGWVSELGVLVMRPIDARYGTLLLADLAAAMPPRTLVTDVRMPVSTPAGANPFALADGKVLSLTRTGVLQELDVEGETLVTLRETVADFRVSEDLRWLLVQDGVPDDPDPLAIGAISLVDRVGNHERPLLDARLSWTMTPFYGAYVAVRSQAWGAERLYVRESGELVVLPEDAVLWHVLDDDRVLYAVGTSDWHDVDLRLWDPRDDSHRQLLRGAALISFTDEGIERFTPDPAFGLQIGRLSLVPYDGGKERELVAQLAWPYVRRDDGSMLSLRDDDGDRLGELRLYPTDGGAPRKLANEAYLHDPSLSRGRAFEPDVVFHGERDGRRGLWRMRVSP